MTHFFAIEHFFEERHAFEKAVRIVPFFYYVLFFIAFQRLEGLNAIFTQGHGDFMARWPIFWAAHVDYQHAVTGIVVGFVFAALIGAFCWRYRIARVAAFGGVLQYHAFLSSFGGPQHQLDLWLWTAFLLIFLPDIRIKQAETSDDRKTFLLVFWTIQAFVLLTYSMSGFLKLYEALMQYLNGQAHAFSFDALALHASTLLLRMHETVPLAPLVINHPFLGWLPFIGVLCLELFSFFIAFKPSLHRQWALGLVLFHIGTYLVMRAIFVSPSILLMILFFESPFQKQNYSWRDSWRDYKKFFLSAFCGGKAL
ncbi:MAG: hypothetical protein U1A23_00340 [Candidatus Sungbacteria bacterium]|nr:hypothetical protein [Candidatus Sungbacteria bacterium]